MLRFEAGRLLQFLGFDKIPEFPVKYISMAYTLSLDLPGKHCSSLNRELFSVDKTVLDMVKDDVHCRHLVLVGRKSPTAREKRGNDWN